jgi:membrane protein required for colicin V production
MDININTAVSFLDVFIVLVLIWAIYKGYKRGPVVHAVSLLIIVVGIALFGAISTSIAGYISDRATVSLDNLDLIVFAVLFTATTWLANFISKKTEAAGAAKPKGIGSIALGILASLVKYLYILSITLLFFAQFNKSYQLIDAGEEERTKLYTTVKSIAPATIKTVSFLDE